MLNIGKEVMDIAKKILECLFAATWVANEYHKVTGRRVSTTEIWTTARQIMIMMEKKTRY